MARRARNNDIIYEDHFRDKTSRVLKGLIIERCLVSALVGANWVSVAGVKHTSLVV